MKKSVATPRARVNMACVRLPQDIARHRKDLICWLGQPVRVNVEVWPAAEGGLLVLALTPLHGFVHLVTDPEACVREYGPYHICICQRALVSQAELDELRQAWDGNETTLPISWVSGDGCMELDNCPLTEGLVRELHDQPDAWYNDQPFHISG